MADWKQIDQYLGSTSIYFPKTESVCLTLNVKNVATLKLTATKTATG